MKKERTLLLLAFFYLFSCRKSEKDIAGVYVKEPSMHTIDSLFLYADSLQSSNKSTVKMYKYEQRFYNKASGEMLFSNVQSWWLFNDGSIELVNLYLDLDNDPNSSSFSPEGVKNSLISSNLPIEGNNIIIDDDQKVFYRKVK